VIGEGVENAAQAEFLRQRGGHIAQGYFYSKPLPAQQFQAWLKDYRAGQSVAAR
jgi:cyclic di-GMP phosphodiesterase Gmr